MGFRLFELHFQNCVIVFFHSINSKHKITESSNSTFPSSLATSYNSALSPSVTPALISAFRASTALSQRPPYSNNSSESHTPQSAILSPLATSHMWSYASSVLQRMSAEELRKGSSEALNLSTGIKKSSSR